MGEAGYPLFSGYGNVDARANSQPFKALRHTIVSFAHSDYNQGRLPTKQALAQKMLHAYPTQQLVYKNTSFFDKADVAEHAKNSKQPTVSENRGRGRPPGAKNKSKATDEAPGAVFDNRSASVNN